MADLKYFISESQRFRAGDGYVEDRMVVGVVVGGSEVRCASRHTALTMGHTLPTLEDSKMVSG